MTAKESQETRIALLTKNHEVMMENFNELKQTQKENHKELTDIIIAMGSKIDLALASKADKKVVDELQQTVRDLSSWKLTILGGVAVVSFLLMLFKDTLLDLIK